MKQPWTFQNKQQMAVEISLPTALTSLGHFFEES